MAKLDISRFLDEVLPDLPSGEDLEYDSDFLQMQQASEGTPERQVGDSVIPAQEPDWKSVRKLALQLLERTRDIRICVCLTRALAHTDGFEGVAQGLNLTRELLERQWETVHPQADPDDDYPILRLNSLTTLNDFFSFLTPLRHIPLVACRGLGQFNLRDIEIALGKAKPLEDEGEPPEMSVINAAFMESELDVLQATAKAAHDAIGDVNAIEALVTEKVGAGNAVSLRALADVLNEAESVLNEKLAARGGGVSGDEFDVSQEAPPPGEQQASASIAGGAMGQISNPDDVVRALDKIIDYYARHEPSSPIPLLLQRAKRLVSKDFMDILRDLAPEGVQQAETIAGLKEE